VRSGDYEYLEGCELRWCASATPSWSRWQQSLGSRRRAGAGQHAGPRVRRASDGLPIWHNTILYPGIDSRSAGARRCQTDDNGVFANQYFTANRCFEADGEFYTFSRCTSSNLATPVYQTRGNTFYADENGTFAPPCGVDGGLAAWQALGQDVGSTVRTTPALDEIMRIANATLG